MEYFNLLEFKKEPFSNSPEPEFLFASPQHNTCLQMLELAVRLRRGLNIVIGEVGTGKTTLCRKLIQNLSLQNTPEVLSIDTFLLLDPAVESRLEFVKTVAGILGIKGSDADDNEWHLKEKIKKILYEKGVDEQKIVALIIDEGQKIPDECLEILREFLNYETNSFKLFQIVIFAQPEFRRNLAARANLLDRVNYLHQLKPLSFKQMKAMIDYRISIASFNADKHSLLTFGGLLAVYWATAGYPRKIVSLCHQVILMMIIRGKNKAGWFLVKSCIRKMPGMSMHRRSWATVSVLLIASAVVVGGLYLSNNPAWQNPSKLTRVASGIDLQHKSVSVVSEPIVEHSSRQFPQIMGSITLKKRMTIWRVFDNIYGDSGNEITQRFIQANPQIKNLNNTTEGMVIKLPVIAAQGYPFKDNVILVSLEAGKNLNEIYYSFIGKNGLNKMPALRFVASWNEKTGMLFVIVLDRRFKSIEEAEEAIRQMPSELSGSARILKQWEDGTIFFNRRLFAS